jgi:hypothetical protein
MERHAEYDHPDGRDTCRAFSHEAKVCQQQTELEAKNTGDVAARSMSDLVRIGSKVAHNGAPIYCNNPKL